MICKLCFRQYVENIDFLQLFRPPDFCPFCRKLYRPQYSTEIIPKDNGYISYHSAFSFSETNPFIKRILFKTMRPYFLQLSKINVDDVLILFIDDDEYNTFSQWYPLFKDIPTIYFLSVFHYDWTVYSDNNL